MFCLNIEQDGWGNSNYFFKTREAAKNRASTLSDSELVWGRQVGGNEVAEGLFDHAGCFFRIEQIRFQEDTQAKQAKIDKNS